MVLYLVYLSKCETMSESYSESTSKLRTTRRQYLITYSKADLVKFPTRESFCDALISCFNATGKVIAEY